jgi:uncharacterized protein (TIGR03435 family)
MMPGVARPVGDMTGIAGRFDFTLDVLGPNSESDGGAKRAMMDWQTVISDVQDQLGLRFESTKTQIENLIIDHAEKPRLDTE